MLWLSINTGPWVLEKEPENTVEWLNYLRTFFPTLVLIVTALKLFGTRGSAKLPPNARLWLIYGLVGTFACLVSPDPFNAAFWAAAYLSVFGAMKLYLKEEDLLVLAHLIILPGLLPLYFFRSLSLCRMIRCSSVQIRA
jgi:hypothetical protein